MINMHRFTLAECKKAYHSEMCSSAHNGIKPVGAVTPQGSNGRRWN